MHKLEAEFDLYVCVCVYMHDQKNMPEDVWKHCEHQRGWLDSMCDIIKGGAVTRCVCECVWCVWEGRLCPCMVKCNLMKKKKRERTWCVNHPIYLSKSIFLKRKRQVW